MPNKKTAVVVIHGIGEQRPMDTLWGFAKAAWFHDEDMVTKSNNELFAKPDQHSKSFDLRRITTQSWTPPNPKRVDFFEFYWAHLMQGNTLKLIYSWIISLFLRPISSVPRGLRRIWLLGWILFLFAAILLLKINFPSYYNIIMPDQMAGMLANISDGMEMIMAISSLIASFLVQAIFIPYVGDAARYLNSAPANVAVRQKIREKGIELIDSLHENEDYDRIIIVGHSLGSVIALDIINHAWGKLLRKDMITAHKKGSNTYSLLETLNDKAKALKSLPNIHFNARKEYRDAQRAYSKSLAKINIKIKNKQKSLWQISDLITLGSPLTNAQILLAKSPNDFIQKQVQREIPKNPPVGEKANNGNFYWKPNKSSHIPHHGAVFAPVVWTNIYFKNCLIIFGDIIGGPLRHIFGHGVIDVSLKIGAPKFRHTTYWKNPNIRPTPYWIIALRKAVNLRHRNESKIWGKDVEAIEYTDEHL